VHNAPINATLHRAYNAVLCDVDRAIRGERQKKRRNAVRVLALSHNTDQGTEKRVKVVIRNPISYDRKKQKSKILVYKYIWQVRVDWVIEWCRRQAPSARAAASKAALRARVRPSVCPPAHWRSLSAAPGPVRQVWARLPGAVSQVRRRWRRTAGRRGREGILTHKHLHSNE
jgi:hypothetical protein